MSAQNGFSKKPVLPGFVVKTAAMLSVIVLILLFAQKLIPVSDEARIKTTRSAIMQLEQALGIFHLDNGFYPTTEQGLSALVSKPSLPMSMLPRRTRKASTPAPLTTGVPVVKVTPLALIKPPPLMRKPAGLAMMTSAF